MELTFAEGRVLGRPGREAAADTAGVPAFDPAGGAAPVTLANLARDVAALRGEVAELRAALAEGAGG